jgi:hypothetical protein
MSVERIGFAGIDRNNGGVFVNISHEFNGETYDYSMNLSVHHYEYCSNIEISIGSTIEPPIEFIDELIDMLKKTKLHMLKNKWKGNVSVGGPS